MANDSLLAPLPSRQMPARRTTISTTSTTQIAPRTSPTAVLPRRLLYVLLTFFPAEDQILTLHCTRRSRIASTFLTTSTLQSPSPTLSTSSYIFSKVGRCRTTGGWSKVDREPGSLRQRAPAGLGRFQVLWDYVPSFEAELSLWAHGGDGEGLVGLKRSLDWWFVMWSKRDSARENTKLISQNTVSHVNTGLLSPLGDFFSWLLSWGKMLTSSQSFEPSFSIGSVILGPLLCLPHAVAS